MSDDLRDFRDATEARPEAVERVKRAVAGELSPADLKALLQTVPSAPEGAAGRVKARVAALAPTPRRPWARVAATLFGVVAVLGVPAGVWIRGEMPVSVELGAEPVEIAGITFEPGGRGTLSGTRAAPRLEWREGRVRLDADADVLVSTREAEVRARREALTLSRDPTGTSVAAERGGIDVRCLVDGSTHAVAVGATFTCPPVSAEGMLGRARHERAAGASADVVLATVDAGLSRVTGSDTARDELAVLRMQLYAEAGRPREALDAARAWLAGGATLRRLDVQRLAAALALAEEGCAGALPHLEALAPTSLDAALRLAACAPDRAAPVLDAAAALARTPEDHAAIAETRSRLGAN